MQFVCNGTTLDVDVLNGGVDIEHSPLRETIQVTANGSVVGSRAVLYETFVYLTVRITSTAQQAALREFILETAGIKGDIVTLVPDSGVDLGAGAGSNITARVWSNYNEPMKSRNLWYLDITFRKEIT